MSSFYIAVGIAFIGAYLLSSIPFGLVITRIMGLGDLRKIGSGNIGATNVLRTGNKFAAALTLILDIGKGGIAVVITAMFMADPVLIAIAAGAAVIGHCYPVWLGFKGGKGVATGIGVIAALNPLVGLAIIGIWLCTAAIFRISSLAAMTAYLAAPILIFTFTEHGHQHAFTAASVVIASISIWRHRENISRLIRGLEPKIGK